ncbi:hypothetical protein COO60DRAFT_1643483 [Scenedesmus sp. NREL 46B-D3]|nr:hypothetical protein COO60DRAFT_1643483 [Scenedesmus sp. NREL 46B-D3]
MQRLLHEQQQQQQQQQQEQQQLHSAAVLQQLTSHLQMLMAHAKKRQQQQQEQKQLMELLNMHITQQRAHSEQRVAQAVVDALGLTPARPLTAAAAEGTQGAGTSSSSSSSSSQGARRRTTRSSSSSVGEQAGVPAEQLAAALGRAARNVALRGKAAPLPHQAAAFASAVTAAAQMAPRDMLGLLLQRPALLWGQDSSAAAAAAAETAAGPVEMLQHLRSQLPGLSLPLLLQRTPALLAAPQAHVDSVLTLLLHRLALSRDQAAAVLEKHPRLLIAGAGPASLNLGFLVGLGLRQPELQQMLLKSADWLTWPLQELTTQWQFVSTVAKASLPDVVLLPELLSLPIRSRLGPRILYARKRQVRLLLPSHEAMLPKLPPQQWLQHKLVPLELWLTASEQRMCAAVGLSLEDFTRFKAAWARVDAFSRPPAGAAPGSTP